MITFKTKLGNISIDAKDGNKTKRLVYSGDRAKELENRVWRLRGNYGHIIGSSASGWELRASLMDEGIEFEIDGDMGKQKTLPTSDPNGMMF